MHCLPLYLDEPSSTWDRELPEYVLFERTLNVPNVRETINMIRSCEYEASVAEQERCKIAELQFAEIDKCGEKQIDTKDILLILRNLIMRAPKSSPYFVKTLKLRAELFYQQRNYKGSENDYNMLLHAYRTLKIFNVIEICVVHGKLAICLYKLLNYAECLEALKNYIRIKDALPKTEENLEKLDDIEKIFLKYEISVDRVETLIVEKCLLKKKMNTPFKGFSKEPNIPLASAACSYREPYKEKRCSIFANSDIPSESLVFIENPILFKVTRPFMQCEFCLDVNDVLYTCFDCCFKTYCSVNCMNKDSETHKLVCLGQKIAVLELLDAECLFNFFIRMLNALQAKIFSDESFECLTTAEEIIINIEKVIDQFGLQYNNDLRYVRFRPEYKFMSNGIYSSLVVIAFRLTMFITIEHHSTLFEPYYKNLKISNKQKLIVTGSILMRLYGHILNKSIEVEYLHSRQSNICLDIFDSIKALEEWTKPEFTNNKIHRVEKFYEIDLKEDILKKAYSVVQAKGSNTLSYPLVQGLQFTKNCDSIRRSLSIYKDYVAETFFNPNVKKFLMDAQDAGAPLTKMTMERINDALADMNTDQRKIFSSFFMHMYFKHMDNYFFNINWLKRKIKPVLMFFCPTLTAFRHSCDPNIELIFVRDGYLFGKSLVNIKKGDEMFVSYKAHHMHHTRNERQSFLKGKNIICECKYCTMPEEEEPSNVQLGLYCDNCPQIELTPANPFCSNCKTHYNAILEKYRKELAVLGRNIEMKIFCEHLMESNSRDTFIVSYLNFQKAKKYFVPSNKYRIRTELEYARFLALKNFGQSAYEVLIELRSNLLQNFQDYFLSFFYNDQILNVIKIILRLNLDYNKHSIQLQHMEDLCNIGLHILKLQKSYMIYYEKFDENAHRVTENIRVFLYWKKKIICKNLPILPNDELNANKYL